MTHSEPRCDSRVFWWDGEYEGECQLSGHSGDHTDGLSWWNDEREDTSDQHPEEGE